MHVGIQTIPLTLTRRNDDKTTRSITLDRVLVQAATPGEDTSEYDTLTETYGVTVHVASPGTLEANVGDRFRWNGQTYVVTSVQAGLMEQNRVVYLPFTWQFRGKLVSR